jgi:hypothetical protein
MKQIPVNIEEACNNADLKCEILGAACTTDKCMCLDGYTPSADKTKCEQGSILFESIRQWFL